MAVATPCWPAPVSAMMRVLPIFVARSTWPRALLILCAPVWQRSSRLSQRRGEARAVRIDRAGEARWRPETRRGPADVARQERRATRRWNGRLATMVSTRARELVERRDERLGDEAAAEGAEVARGIFRSHGWQGLAPPRGAARP